MPRSEAEGDSLAVLLGSSVGALLEKAYRWTQQHCQRSPLRDDRYAYAGFPAQPRRSTPQLPAPPALQGWMAHCALGSRLEAITRPARPEAKLPSRAGGECLAPPHNCLHNLWELKGHTGAPLNAGELGESPPIWGCLGLPTEMLPGIVARSESNR